MWTSSVFGHTATTKRKQQVMLRSLSCMKDYIVVGDSNNIEPKCNKEFYGIINNAQAYVVVSILFLKLMLSSHSQDIQM